MNGILYAALLIGITALGLTYMLAALRKIPDEHSGVVFRLGRLSYELSPGNRWVIPLLDQVMLVDLRERDFKLPADLIVTDSTGTYAVNGSFTCRVLSPTSAVMAALQAQQPIEQTVGNNLLVIIQEIGVQTARDSKRAPARILAALNEQMSPAWQLKFTKVEFELTPTLTTENTKITEK
jgi:regulator of protease activity HflC (stomatin/prohibitin superfamily)